MDYPEHQIGFEKMFSTEKQCIEYLMAIRWIDGYTCSKCMSKKYWFTERNRIVCSECGFQTTPIAGTIFEQTNKPLTLWYRAIWWMIAQKNGVSATGLQKILGLGSYTTAWSWLQKLRTLTVNPEREKLSGRIEIDETLVGGRSRGKRGRGAEKKKVVVIAVEVLEKGTGRVRIKIVPRSTSKCLIGFIIDNVEYGSTIFTDGLNSYSKLNENGYLHKVDRAIVKTEYEELLPNVHRVASLLKRWLIGTHQNFVSNERMQYYLDEFVFRYNRRKSKSRGLLFERIIEQAVKHKPIGNDRVFKNKMTLQN